MLETTHLLTVLYLAQEITDNLNSFDSGLLGARELEIDFSGS